MEPTKPTTTAKKPRNNRKALLATTIITLILGIIVGAYLWNSQIKELKANRDADGQKIQELNQKIEELQGTVQEGEESNTDTLKVDKWSIGFRQPGYKLSYKFEKTNGVEYLMLTDSRGKSLTGLEGCSDMTDGYYPVAISRYSEKLSDSDAELSTYLGKVGSYHYYMSAANGICSEATADQEGEIRTYTIGASKTIYAL